MSERDERSKPWRFYGRASELSELATILDRRRWCFVKVTGRRRIGKTALINMALKRARGAERHVIYVTIPDSAPAGVLSAVGDALETFNVPPERYPRPQSLDQFARLIEALLEDGWLVVLDEFQYVNRKSLFEFCSFLQAGVDRLTARASEITGALIVLGSIHGEMTALLDDRVAPLYNRTTDAIELTHLDIASVLAILSEHADPSPERLLFFWTLFEGVPKFYRDAYEQEVLDQDRLTVLRRIFFESSSPLRSEAENWFLRELRGRYDTILKFVARVPGRLHGDLVQAIRDVDGSDDKQVGGYLKTMIERYQLIERKQPVFAKPNARRGRYYLRDNFLQAWLGALAQSVSARDFRPLPDLIEEADQRLAKVEGICLERLVAILYHERSRKGVGDFPLTERIDGYWDRADTEIDLVAINEADGRIRFGSCKRNSGRLVTDAFNFIAHVERFLTAFPAYRSWTVERVAIAPRLDDDARKALNRAGLIPQDLNDLTAGLK